MLKTFFNKQYDDDRMDPVIPHGDPGCTDDPYQNDFKPETQEEEDTNMTDTESWEENEQEYSQLSVLEEQADDDAGDDDKSIEIDNANSNK